MSKEKVSTRVDSYIKTLINKEVENSSDPKESVYSLVGKIITQHFDSDTESDSVKLELSKKVNLLEINEERLVKDNIDLLQKNKNLSVDIDTALSDKNALIEKLNLKNQVIKTLQCSIEELKGYNTPDIKSCNATEKESLDEVEEVNLSVGNNNEDENYYQMVDGDHVKPKGSYVFVAFLLMATLFSLFIYFVYSLFN